MCTYDINIHTHTHRPRGAITNATITTTITIITTIDIITTNYYFPPPDTYGLIICTTYILTCSIYLVYVSPLSTCIL